MATKAQRIKKLDAIIKALEEYQDMKDCELFYLPCKKTPHCKEGGCVLSDEPGRKGWHCKVIIAQDLVKEIRKAEQNLIQTRNVVVKDGCSDKYLKDTLKNAGIHVVKIDNKGE